MGNNQATITSMGKMVKTVEGISNSNYHSKIPKEPIMTQLTCWKYENHNKTKKHMINSKFLSRNVKNSIAIALN